MGIGWLLASLFFVGLYNVDSVRHREVVSSLMPFILIDAVLAVIIVVLPTSSKHPENSALTEFLIFMGWSFPVILGLYWSWLHLKHAFALETLFPPTPLLLTVIGFELFLILVAVLLTILLNFMQLIILEQNSFVGYQSTTSSFTPSFMMTIFIVLWFMLNLYSSPYIISSFLLPDLVDSLFFVIIFWTFQFVTSSLLSLLMFSLRKSMAHDMIASNFGALIESLAHVDWNDPGSWHSFVRSIFNDLDVQTVNELFNELHHVLPILFYQIEQQHRSWSELTAFLESQAYILKNHGSNLTKDDSLQDFKVDYLLWKISYFFYALRHEPSLVRALLAWGDNVLQVNMFQAFMIRVSLKLSRERISSSILSQVVEHICQLGFPEFLLETNHDRFYHLLDIDTRSYLVLNLLFNTNFELVSDKSVSDFSFTEMVRTRLIPRRLFWESIMNLSMLGADPLFSLLYPLMSSYPDNWTKNEMLWKMYGLHLEEPAMNLLLVGRYVDLRVLNNMELFFEWLLQSFSQVSEDTVHFAILAWQLQQSLSN